MDRYTQNTMLITSHNNGEITYVTHLGPFLRRFKKRLAKEDATMLGQETAYEAFKASKEEDFEAHRNDKKFGPAEHMSYQHYRNKDSILPQNLTQPK